MKQSKYNNYYSEEEMQQIDLDGIFITRDLMTTIRKLELELIRENDNEG